MEAPRRLTQGLPSDPIPLPMGGSEKSVSIDKALKDTKPNNSTSSSIITPRMWFAVSLITAQSFVFGFEISALNTAIVTGDANSGSSCFDGSDKTCPKGSIYQILNLSTLEVSLATSLLIVGAWIGCMVASGPSETYGRKPTLMWNNVLLITGAVAAASGNAPLLYVGRVISGLGVGITSVTVPVLLAEVASAETRGWVYLTILIPPVVFYKL